MKTIIRYVLVFAVAIALAAVVRYYYLETYLVQSISMNNTLIEGDKLMVIKTKKFHSGDVLIFLHNQGTYVKRILGLPGDTIQIIHGILYVNQRKRAEKYIRPEKKSDAPERVDPAIMNCYGKNWTVENFGPYIVPRQGSKITLDKVNLGIYRTLLTDEATRAEVERSMNHAYSFKNDYYFMLGDNRSFSEDSRMYGPVTLADIIGKAHYILFSENNIWKRLFKKI